MAYSKLMMGIGAGALAILGVSFGVTLQAPDKDPLLRNGPNVSTRDMPLSPNNGILANSPQMGRQLAPHKPPMDLQDWNADGFMGDGKAQDRYLQVDSEYPGNPRTPPSCMRISYKPGPTGWAGQYWLNVKDNWGQQAGEDLGGYQNVVFWARGEHGGELVEFKAGALDATRSAGIQYKDSFGTSLGTVPLSPEWRQYRINLRGLDLSNVIGAFAWVATEENNPNGVVFYLDDLRYE